MRGKKNFSNYNLNEKLIILNNQISFNKDLVFNISKEKYLHLINDQDKTNKGNQKENSFIDLNSKWILINDNSKIDKIQENI